ncbi:acyltransferase family protein [Pararcticibacter amylolyticus]|uniref:Acyltransferase 3 domain-containing protein n=1 Tax=Pararcticibacter amylolyticus TaxID=2173175 RepID=A0A2U2PBS2_9SPHI|nr:acyltransferase [Pararcticibacter amylolyticus]PWG78805.1 hypothetical protein DDR33_20485 [Pararcticibacter amylolyticus]
MNNTYLPYFDGFRGIAIMLVILGHLGFGNFIPGGFGVTLFFFISGFLITRLLIFEYHKNQTIDIKKFYVRRLLRLYPALLTMIAVTSALIFLTCSNASVKPYIFSGIFYYTNYYISFFRSAAPLDCERVFDALWSLAVEEHFYLFFPFIFLFFNKNTRHLISILILIAILSLLIRLFILMFNNDFNQSSLIIYHSTHTRVDSIIYGCLSAILIYKQNSKTYMGILNNKLTVFIGVALILISLLYRDPLFRESIRYSIQGLALMLLLPGPMFYPSDSLLKKLIESPALIFIGKLSYSLYLFNGLCIMMMNEYFQENFFEGVHSAKWMAATISLTIIFSLTSYYLVEKPFVHIRKQFGSNVL